MPYKNAVRSPLELGRSQRAWNVSILQSYYRTVS